MIEGEPKEHKRTRSLRHSFKFVDRELNRQAIRLIQKAGIRCRVDNQDVIHYSGFDQERVENELIRSIRSQSFHSGLFCRSRKIGLSDIKSTCLSMIFPIEKSSEMAD